MGRLIWKKSIIEDITRVRAELRRLQEQYEAAGIEFEPETAVYNNNYSQHRGEEMLVNMIVGEMAGYDFMRKLQILKIDDIVDVDDVQMDVEMDNVNND